MDRRDLVWRHGMVGDRLVVIYEDQGDQRGPMETARTFVIRTVNMVSH